jgi:hypothetical protein
MLVRVLHLKSSIYVIEIHDMIFQIFINNKSRLDVAWSVESWSRLWLRSDRVVAMALNIIKWVSNLTPVFVFGFINITLVDPKRTICVWMWSVIVIILELVKIFKCNCIYYVWGWFVKVERVLVLDRILVTQYQVSES